MIYQLIIKPRAIEMVQEACDWYNEQQFGLGEEFLKEVEDGYDKLESWPEVYQKIKWNCRQLVLQKFPYAIVFEIIKKEVVVYAVFHTSRNPSKKFRKR